VSHWWDFDPPTPEKPHFSALLALESNLRRIGLSKNFCQPT
jgi:hypothetical protein